MSEQGQDKRQDIKDRIAAAQARNDEREGASLVDTLGEKATEAKDNFTAFAREHPLATIAGGLAVGVLISAMFKNSPTRKAGRFAGTRAVGLAAIGSEMAVAFAHQVMEQATRARDAGAEVAHDVGEKVGDTAQSARVTARDIGKSIARSFSKH